MNEGFVLVRTAIFLAAAVLIAACGSSDDESSERGASPTEATSVEATSTTSAEVDLTALHLQLVTTLGPAPNWTVLEEIVQAGDDRSAWIVSDVMRFYRPGDGAFEAIGDSLSRLGVAPDPENPWRSSIDQLLAEDRPAPDDYRDIKVALLSTIDSRWAPLFEGETDVDYRWLNWGGVFIDDRELGDAGPCIARGCIPALDFPATVPASEGGWYADDKIVFGVVVDGEARAYPKNMMEVHEMVNDTIGGRRIGMPYCTLCGSAQAYLTDEGHDGDEPLVLRTSGLLSRSNKVMYDLTSSSIFDTFTGRAVTGPLFLQDVELTQVTVRVSPWGDWKAAHPDTRIVAPDGGIGRVYPEDPLQGRDADGPIFPVGEVDPRLGVQEAVIGVVAPDGSPVAFAVADLEAFDGDVTHGGVTVVSDGAGFTALDASGQELVSHEAFWFAWSQFWPGTALWTASGPS